MISEKFAKKYCSEDISKIENYEQAVADTTQMWHCHHRLEVQGQFRNSEKLLKKCGLYYHVPASQLIFLTHGEHIKLHRLGVHLSEETKKKMSMSLSGQHHSAETKKKISIANSGEKNPMFGKRGYWSGKHLSEETKKKLSLSLSGKCGEKHPVFGTQWWNNGSITKRAKECPGEGWVRGRKPR